MGFEQFLLLTDGDTSILNGIKCVNILFQRCLWHIPHQLKYYLWSDGVARKSTDWLMILAKIFNIVSYRSFLEEEEIEAVLREKNMQIDDLIEFCHEHNYKACAAYLQNAKPDMFTCLKNRLEGKATSLVERVMRTVNMRINVGKWTSSGALNATKVRLEHYYNDWQPGEPAKEDIKITRL